MNHENMVYYSNMEDKTPNAKYYFSESLRAAIDEGDTSRVVEAVETQPASFVTEGISNRLIVRDFLVTQKQRLVQLDDGLDEATNGRLDEYAQAYIHALDTDLKDAFITDEGAENQKLTGDDRLRSALREPSATINLARHIASIDVRKLTPPDAIVDWMQNVRDSIVELLWEAIQDYKEDDSATGTGVASVRKAIAQLIEDMDRKISGSLLQ